MARNQSLVAVLSFAGDKTAALDLAMQDLTRGIVQILRHGNQRPLLDTVEFLPGKVARVVAVRTLVQACHSAAMAHFSLVKHADDKTADKVADSILSDAWADFDAAALVAASERADKAAKSKAAKEKAAKTVAKTAAAVAPTVELARALTLADALAMVGAACAAGDEQALNGVQAIAEVYFDPAIA